MAHNPTYKTIFFEASPSKEPALTNTLTNAPIFKKARYIEFGKHEAQPPNRRTIDGIVMLDQSMTHNTLQQIIPVGVNISKTPPYHPPAGDTWTTVKMTEFVKRGDQAIGDYQQFGASGALYDPNANQIFTFGNPPHQGKRTDIDEMIEEAATGTCYPELANRFPKLDGQNAMKKARIRFLNTQSRNSCEVIVRYGMTDTCKTHMAINSDWPTESQYVKVCTKDNKWFCDYDGQRKIILDELRGAKQKMELATLNQWLQEHDICYVEPKFGRCKLIAEKFAITSSMHPTKWFPENLDDPDDNIDQLIRRISVIYQHTKTQPALGVAFTTTHNKQGEAVYISETRRGPIETTAAWCARVRAMSGAA